MMNFGAPTRLDRPQVIDNQGLYSPYQRQQLPPTAPGANDMVGRAISTFGMPNMAMLAGTPGTGGLEPNPNYPPGTGGLEPNPYRGYGRSIKPSGPPNVTGGLMGASGTALPSPGGLSRPMGFGGPQNGGVLSRPLFQGVGGVSTTRPDVLLQPPRQRMPQTPYGYGAYGTRM